MRLSRRTFLTGAFAAGGVAVGSWAPKTLAQGGPRAVGDHDGHPERSEQVQQCEDPERDRRDPGERRLVRRSPGRRGPPRPEGDGPGKGPRGPGGPSRPRKPKGKPRLS